MNAQGAQWDYKCIPVNVQGDQRGISLEMDQESSGIELVYVCVWEGGEGRLGCGFILLYSIFYVLYSKFYILYMLHILTSILLLPSLCTILNILLRISSMVSIL